MDPFSKNEVEANDDDWDDQENHDVARFGHVQRSSWFGNVGVVLRHCCYRTDKDQ